MNDLIYLGLPFLRIANEYTKSKPEKMAALTLYQPALTTVEQTSSKSNSLKSNKSHEHK